MKLVRFKGKKEGGMWAMLPIGVKRLGLCTGKVHFNPCAELSDEDAEKLIKMHPDMYEVIREGEFTQSMPEAPKKRRGRPKKVEALSA